MTSKSNTGKPDPLSLPYRLVLLMINLFLNSPFLEIFSHASHTLCVVLISEYKHANRLNKDGEH